jgi:hypothetical protein
MTDAFNPARDSYGNDAGIDNAERRRRHEEYNQARGLVSVPPPTGNEIARQTTLMNLGVQLSASLRSLEGFQARLSAGGGRNARIAYDACYKNCLKLAGQYAQMTGTKMSIPGYVENTDPLDVVVQPDGTCLEVPAKPKEASFLDTGESKIKVGNFSKGYGRG